MTGKPRGEDLSQGVAKAGGPGRFRIGVDTGGTFTDVVAVDEGSGRVVTTKTPSTPADPAAGFVSAVHKVLDLMALPGEHGGRPASIAHGTTVATNQLLEGELDGLGFITTEGYEFVLEIARQSVPDGYGNSYFWIKPARIVPVRLVRTVPGRLDYRGAEIRPFDESRAAEVARWFRSEGVHTIGVCFLHSYANPAHELAMREVLAREHPDAIVSISSEVLREYREYERSVTTLVDAAVKPRVSRYIANLTRSLAASTGQSSRQTGGVPLQVMKSNGGVISAEQVAGQPITTVLSGPAAGALGAAYLAAHAGVDQVVTLDGGGTSTDVSLVVGGQPALTTEGRIGRFPSRIPMVDVITVGAGGGSIAWISREGTLKVGPHSAGADPGPLCYTPGGSEPTITDAHLTLGRIPPHLLGGEIPLNEEAADAGLRRLAWALGMEPAVTASGILEVSAWNQANAIRQVTTERGLDVRGFMLVTFGGSGSLLACRLVDLLGLRGVIVPPDPGTVSAYGLLTVDIKDDYVQTRVACHDDLDPGELGRIYAGLEEKAGLALDKEGIARTEHRYARTADLRYVGQAFEVRVQAPPGPIDNGFLSAVERSFHDEHERLYGYSYRDTQGMARHDIEWVNLRVTGIGPTMRPQLPSPPVRAGCPDPVPTGERPVYFDSWVDTPTYERSGLTAGDELAGPAVVEEYGATTPVHPGFSVYVDSSANMILTPRGGSSG